MSRENVEIVKRGIDAFNRRDIDAFMELVAEDYEMLPAFATIVEGGSYRGRESLQRYFEMLDETWKEIRMVPEEFRDLGGCVLALGRGEGKGRGGGVPVEAPLGLIVDFRGDKISRTRTYLDHGEALRAAGLAEEKG